jgi:hypothetical protein
MLLNLALMPHHSPSLVMELAEWTPSTARTPHWSWGAWLAGGSCADTPLFRRSFQGRPLLTEQLLLCTEPVEKDETLRPHVAVLELYGLGDSSP